MLSIFRLSAAVLIALSAVCAPALRAEDAYPSRNIRLVVPFGAGGPTDVIARLVGDKLSEKWGKQAIIENIVGAGGNTGTAAVAKAAPDGYTLLVVSTGFIVNPHLYAKVPYDPVRNFTPVSLFAASPNVLSVHPSFPAKTAKELIDLVKANPGKYSYAQPATGSTPHLAGELFKLQYGLDLATVSFNNAAMAITNVMGGHVPISFTALPPALPNIQAGKLRGIAILSSKRAPGLPDVPTMAEAGIPDQESDTLTGIVAPAGTPKAVIEQWHAELARIIGQPEVKKQLETMGFEPLASRPEEFAARIESEGARWARIIRDAKIRID